MHLGDGRVGAGDPAQDRLKVLARQRLRAIEGAAVEIHHAQMSIERRPQIHAGRRQGEAQAQRMRIGEGDVGDVAGEQRRRAG